MRIYDRGAVPQLVTTELRKARERHRNMRTLHEGYAVLLEEVDEFWDEVKKRNPDPNALLEELVQISAMAQRVAEDVVQPILRQEAGII